MKPAPALKVKNELSPHDGEVKRAVRSDDEIVADAELRLQAKGVAIVRDDFEDIPDLEETETAPREAHFRSDVGYADAFAERHRDRIRFIPEEGVWLIFDPSRGWHRDRSGEVEALAADFARELYEKALEEAKSLDPKEGHGRIQAAAALGNKKRITPALSIAQVNPVLVTHSEELDRDPYLLGTLNGVIDLRDGTFRPHSPAVLVTRSVSCTFDPHAECPTFLRFLEEVQPDPEVRSYLQRLTGYTLTGSIGEHLLPFHYGVGANGKGTFLEQTLFKILGTYAAKITDSLVYANPRGSEPHLEIAGLSGIRFALGEENEDGGNLNERLLKSMTGGDRQKGRFHYCPFFEFNPTAKIHLVGNHRPKIVGRDDGIWRRFRLVEWSVKIPEERRNLRLDQKLATEFPGILNWMIQGALALGDRGTCPPSSVIAATDRFRQDSDDFGTFLREKTVEDPEGVITKADLYAAYKEYCDEQEIREVYRFSKKKVGKLIFERGYDEGTIHQTKEVWRGIRARKMSD
jgi:putative DNA primase/helicase